MSNRKAVETGAPPKIPSLIHDDSSPARADPSPMQIEGTSDPRNGMNFGSKSLDRIVHPDTLCRSRNDRGERRDTWRRSFCR
jgi:hypothetical protein